MSQTELLNQPIITDSTTSNTDIISLLSELSTTIYNDNKKKGFWDDPLGTLIKDLINNVSYVDLKGALQSILDLKEQVLPNGRNKGEQIALMHSELSEALEGLRKNLPSDHIPEFTAEEEEIADLLVRLLDYSGGHGLRLGEAFVAKLNYNRTRPFKHGKKF